jgi:hypothetical protein
MWLWPLASTSDDGTIRDLVNLADEWKAMQKDETQSA